LVSKFFCGWKIFIFIGSQWYQIILKSQRLRDLEFSGAKTDWLRSKFPNLRWMKYKEDFLKILKSLDWSLFLLVTKVSWIVFWFKLKVWFSHQWRIRKWDLETLKIFCLRLSRFVPLYAWGGIIILSKLFVLSREENLLINGYFGRLKRK